jgi:hypothetical protein
MVVISEQVDQEDELKTDIFPKDTLKTSEEDQTALKTKNKSILKKGFLIENKETLYGPEGSPEGTYSGIGLLRIHGNLQSYWTTAKLLKLIVVLDYYEAMETHSRIGRPRSYGNLQSYWTTAKLWKRTVVLD